MADDIYQLLARCSVGSSAGPRFAKELTDQDRRTLDAWLATQRNAERPEESIWHMVLLNNKPLFRGLFENVIQGKWSQLIRECAEPLNVAKERDLAKEFPILGDRGIHFLLVGIDHQKIGVYGGEKPVLLDFKDDFGVWKIDTKDSDNISVREAELTDIPVILLREWSKARPRLRRARERLCDILSICLAKS